MRTDAERATVRAYQTRLRRDPRTWPRTIISIIKQRARRRGIPFDLTLNDLAVPDKCPVLGIRLEPGARVGSHSSPSVDRFDNTKGYVKGNIRIISKRANALKSDATLKEMRSVLRYMEGRREGRPRPTPKPVDVAKVLELRDRGLAPLAIAAELGVGKSSVYRILSRKASPVPL